MTTSTTLIAVGGTLIGALGGTWLTGLQAKSRSREEHDHEQLTELRGLLDEAAVVLRRASLLDGQALVALNPTMSSADTFRDALGQLDDALADAITIDARIELRVGPGHRLSEAFAEAVFSLQDVVNSYVVARQDGDFDSVDRRELKDARKALGERTGAFLAEARDVVGTRSQALNRKSR